MSGWPPTDEVLPAAKAAEPAVVPPKIGRPWYVVLARPRMDERSWVSSVAIAVRDAASPLPVFAAWTTRSRTRLNWSLTDVSVESTVVSQPSPSEALRAYWLLRSISPCSDRALIAPLGSSDARLIRRPDDNCSWRVAPRCRADCRLASDIDVIELFVTRMVRPSQ